MVFAFQDTQRTGRDRVHGPPRRNQWRSVRVAEPRHRAPTTTRRRSSQQPRAARRDAFAGGAARCDGVVLHAPGARRRRARRRRAPTARRARADGVDAPGHRRCPAWCWWSGSPTASRCCSPTRTAGVVARGRTPAGRAWWPASCRAPSTAMRGARRRHLDGAGSGRTCAAPATRCPSRCAPRWRGRPGGVRRDVAGARRPSTSAPACWPSCAADGRAGRRRWRAARSRTRTCSPTGGRAQAPAGSPGWCGCARERRRPRRRSPATSSAVRGRIAAACARAGRSPDEVTLTVVTKFFPASDVRPARRARRPPRGGEPAPGGRGQGAPSAPTSTSTWHFVGGLQSNKAAAVAALRRRGGVRRPRQAAARACPGAPTSATATVDVLVQVGLDDDPARRRGRAGVAPRRRTGARASGSRGRGAAAARGDGGGAARRGSRAGVRETGRGGRRRCAASTPPRRGSRRA